MTLTGALLFAKHPEFLLPIFHLKAVSYPGTDIHTTTYLENKDVVGRLETQFEDSIAFVLRHLRWMQNGRGINSLGVLEIISPGHLPNNLSVANIRSGTSNIRNPILASFATRILPCRGLGTGIVRALQEYPAIEFEDDRERNEFRAIVRRKV